MASHATAQSGSILIVDGTGLDLPSMSGALVPEGNFMDQQGKTAPLLDVPVGHGPVAFDRAGSIDAVATQRSSNVLGNEPDFPAVPGGAPTVEQATIGGDQDSGFSQTDPILARAEKRTPSTTTASSETIEGDPSLGLRQSIQAHARELGSGPGLEEGQQGDEVESEHDTETKFPAPTLRRRPGGDLRRVENVQELDHATTHHDSLGTATASPHESLLIMKTQMANRSASADGPPPAKRVSMINTHSSQHLRPSFEAAVASFSAIPDDDDGGLEATLMKLEGRYDKQSPPIDQHPRDAAGKRRSLPEFHVRSQHGLAEPSRSVDLAGSAPGATEPQIRETIQEVASEASPEPLAYEEAEPLATRPQSSRRSSIYGLPTESIADSEDSTSSLPLLKRDAAHESSGRPFPFGHTSPPIAPGYFPQDPPQLFHLPKGPPPSATKARYSFPRPDTGNESNRSFLLDEDENLSDLSSEISVDIINYAEVAGRSMSPMLAAPGTALSGLEIPAHPLTYASVVNLDPPEASGRVSGPVAEPNRADADAVHGTNASGPGPEYRDSASSHPSLGRLPAGPAHIPFVLVCDSQVLAQQMTLVEKSALSEVEWSDLVEMRWDSKAADVLDWVDCLINDTIHGIDLVITRFNLVVKWAVSEIVLTQDIDERARVMTKFIHVAAHARRLHNYATMLQLTIALTSIDCSRLSKTWDIVSAPDKSLLKHMEALVQPIRNFHDLRLEMESADLSDGCIPFIGIYPP
jgi:hypothetical protein